LALHAPPLHDALPISWRVGAKPGQVGTHENDGLVALYGTLISGALPHVSKVSCEAPPYYDCDVDTCACVPSDPDAMIEGITDWADRKSTRLNSSHVKI